tara:strand:- start:10491 stop:10922 length:432 start_codon:yes stop_codon:yes gene_type:complete
MYAALIAYKKGIYFTAHDDEALWQLSLHSRYCPGLADFDLKQPKDGSMFTHGGASRSWSPLEGDGEYYEQVFNGNFLKDQVLAELAVWQKELKKAKGLHPMEDYDRIIKLEKEIWKKTEELMKERESVRCFDPDRTTGKDMLS